MLKLTLIAAFHTYSGHHFPFSFLGIVVLIWIGLKESKNLNKSLWPREAEFALTGPSRKKKKFSKLLLAKSFKSFLTCRIKKLALVVGDHFEQALGLSCTLNITCPAH